MTPEQVATHLESLPGCKRKGNAERPAWYVDDRLVARLEDRTTLTVRCAVELREEVVGRHPETFGVTPRMEGHRKVQVALDHGNDRAIRDVITAAWELQRRH